MAELAKAGDFCPNPACSDYEQLDGRIIRHGRTRAGIQRLQMPELRKNVHCDAGDDILPPPDGGSGNS